MQSEKRDKNKGDIRDDEIEKPGKPPGLKL